MTIYEKLSQIQTKFKSKKSRFNSFGKYYFRSAEDILEATKPFLLELGVTVTVNEELIKQLSEYALRKEEISINLEDQEIKFGNNVHNFEIDEFKKKCLLEGLDDISLSLAQSSKISAYEEKIKSSKPWIFND